jgi:AbrB family looped-hinge helix DNA binding protein
MAHGRILTMKATMVPIDKAGRVVLPKWVRESANLLPGDELKVSLEGQRIQLEPAVDDSSGLVRKGRALVFRGNSGKVLTSELVEKLRGERLVTLAQAAQAKRK